MAYNKIGRIRPAYVGEWVSSKAYDALDIVKTANGSMSYIAQKDVPAGTPLSNSSYWALVLDVQNTLNAADAAIQRANEQTDNAVARADAAVGRVDNAMDGKISSLTASVSGNSVRIRAEEHSTIKPLLTFKPVQAGIGDPYPAGGGRNLLKPGSSVTTNGITFTVNNDGGMIANGTATAGAVFGLPFDKVVGETYTLTGCPTGGGNGKYIIQVANGSNDYGDGATFTATEQTTAKANIIIWEGQTVNNLVFKPMLVKGSTKYPYEPYSNIRPITGRTGAVLTRCGKNLLNAPSVININSETSIEGRVFEIPLHIPAGTYTFSIDGYAPDNNGQMELVFYYTLETWEEVYPNAFTDKHNTPWSFTFTSDKPIRHCAVYVRAGDDTYTVKNAMLELGSAATAYEPYQGDIFTLNFGQTVYGGMLDWNKGEMVVDTGFAAFDGSENWVIFTYADGRQSFYTSGSSALPGIMSGTYIYVPGICSWSPSVDGYITDIFRTDLDSAAIEIKPDVLSKWGIGDLDTFKARLAANPMQIAYKLANPITIQLTPDYVSALFGEWTYYSNADQMTVNYNLDLLEILEKNEDAHREKANGLKSSITGNPVQIYPDEGSIIKPLLTLQPIQEGSGEPYPAGGGKNLLGGFTDASVNGVTFKVNTDGSVSVSGTSAYQTNINATIHLKPGTYTLSGCPKGGSSANVAGGYALYTRIANAHYKWDTGEGVTFTLDNEETLDFSIIVRGGTTINATFYPQLEVGSTATPYTPCSNIRPITGRTGAVLVRCGKNLFDASTIKVGYFVRYDAGLENPASSQIYAASDYIPVKNMIAFTHYFASNDVGSGIAFYDKRKQFVKGMRIGDSPFNELNTVATNTITLESDIAYMRFSLMVEHAGKFQIELGSTASTYEPYQGDTYTLDFGKTVYNGMLDCSNGELTTSVPVRELTGNEGWNKASSAPNTFYFDYYSPGGNAGNPSLLNDICSHYKTASNTAYGSENAYYPLSYTGAIYRHMFTDKRFNDVASWKAYLAEQKSKGTPVQVTECAIAHTTTSTKIDPVKIIALDGVNTLYSDADNMTINYNKDLTVAYKELMDRFAAIEAAMVNDI